MQNAKLNKSQMLNPYVKCCKNPNFETMTKIQNEIQAQSSKRKRQNYNLKRKAKSSSF